MCNYTNKHMLQEVEIARERMIKLAEENSLTSKVVIDASVRLDKLLNCLAQINRYS